MAWVSTVLVSLISGVVGLFLAGFIANSCVSWYRISSREGQSGYFVILIAIVGGMAGLFLGTFAASIVSWCFGPSFFSEWMSAVACLLLAAGLFAWISRSLADVPPKIDGSELNLEVEFRFPDNVHSNQPPTAEGEWQFTFASNTGRTRRKHLDGTVRTEGSRFENGRWIVPTHVELFTERGSRSVTLCQRHATEVMGFMLPLPARPSVRFEQWSEWLPLQQSGGQPWPSDKMSCRFRVQRILAPNDSKLP